MLENEKDRAALAATWEERIKKSTRYTASFCKKYHIHDAQMSRWIHGVKVPSRLMAAYIEDALSNEGV